MLMHIKDPNMFEPTILPPLKIIEKDVNKSIIPTWSFLPSLTTSSFRTETKHPTVCFLIR